MWCIGTGLRLAAILALTSIVSFAQEQRYLVFFKEKPDSLLPYPELYLSPQAIERRLRQGIPLDQHDLPIPKAWIDSLSRCGRVLSTSRWLNAALIEVPSAAFLTKYDFIACVELLRYSASRGPSIPRARPTSHQLSLEAPTAPLSDMQLAMLQIPQLHQSGLSGRGIRIAILDAGFPGMNQVAPFAKPLSQGRFIAGYDFVSQDSLIFDDNLHGTMVASVIFAQDSVSGFIGGAPEVEFLLARTEDANSETQQEEWNWARAAEWADSLGAYIIQSSLGYSTFDDPSESYTYGQLNGQTAITTRAARIAAQKGLLVVNSAGNEGNSPWRHITAPADADSMLAAGAVNANGQLAFFSSRGPTADGRIKPDVVAMGWGTRVILSNGQVGSASGTSFSAPLITSLAACLWQAQPQAHAQIIRRAIIESADRFSNPDTAYGYGLPNGLTALNRLTFLVQSSSAQTVRLFPNLATERISFTLMDTTLQWYQLSIYDESGRQIFTTSYRGLTTITIPIQSWRNGLYWLHLIPQSTSRQNYIVPFVKL